jgi:hypothetical protein
MICHQSVTLSLEARDQKPEATATAAPDPTAPQIICTGRRNLSSNSPGRGRGLLIEMNQI